MALALNLSIRGRGRGLGGLEAAGPAERSAMRVSPMTASALTVRWGAARLRWDGDGERGIIKEKKEGRKEMNTH